jgi:hypothetical protein
LSRMLSEDEVSDLIKSTGADAAVVEKFFSITFLSDLSYKENWVLSYMESKTYRWDSQTCAAVTYGLIIAYSDDLFKAGV